MTNDKRFFGKFYLLVMLVLILVMQPGVAAQQHYTFAIVPQQSASKLAQVWGPIVRHLSEQTGTVLRFTTAKDIPTFEANLAKGLYDFAYMNPYHYTVFSKKSGYRAFVNARNKRIKGIVVVHKDSPVQTLEELEGAQLAFPAPAAFAASILTQAELNARGISFEPKYVSSHDSVYLTVAKGLYLAGGGVVRTLNSVAPEIRDQLRVLWSSAGFTPHAIAANPKIPLDVVEALQRALVDMNESEAGRVLLTGLSREEGFQPAQDADWDNVRTLQLGPLSTR
jgi:phosphonate transport system substrate-binding protein